jgi:hypothetical protein
MIPDLAQNIDLHLFKQSVLNGSLLSSLWTPSLKDVTMLLFVKPLSRRVAFALLFTAWITPPPPIGASLGGNRCGNLCISWSGRVCTDQQKGRRVDAECDQGYRLR